MLKTVHTYKSIVNVEEHNGSDAHCVVENGSPQQQNGPAARGIPIFSFLQHDIIPSMSKVNQKDQLRI